MTELLELLQKRDDDTTVITDSYSQVKFSSDAGNIMQIEGEDFYMTELAFESLMNDVQIPKKYAERCPSSLLDQNVNYWLQAKGAETPFTGLISNGRLRAIVKPEYTYVPTVDLVNEIIISDEIPAGYEFQNIRIDDNEVAFTLLTERKTGEKVGDISRAGLNVALSDSWTVAPKFDTMLLRLICLNGMTTPISGRKFRISRQETEQILTQVSDFVGAAFDQIDQLILGYESLRDQNVDNANRLLRRIVKENHLPMKVYDALLEATVAGDFQATMHNSEIETMFDVANILTWVGTHNGDLTDGHREHLRNIAASLSLTGSTRCNSCGSSV